MRTLITLILTVILTSPAAAEWESIAHLYQKEEAGLRHYERGDYDKAFEDLSETAIRGLKKSQYILAFMFMKGQHVEKSTLLGLGWLGVARESGQKEWVDLYDSIYELTTPAQQTMIDAKVEQYIAWYGSVAQNVECSEQHSTVGSRRKESSCLKVDGPQYEIHPVELRP